MYRLLLFCLALAVPLAGCGSDTEAAPTDDHAGEAPGAHSDDASDEADDHGDEITLTEAQAAAADVETAVVQASPLAAEIRVPARIVPTESGQAQVGALVDGRVVRLLAAEGQSHLKSGAKLMAEFGDGQASAIVGLFSQAGWPSVTIANDLSHQPRIVIASAGH